MIEKLCADRERVIGRALQRISFVEWLHRFRGSSAVRICEVLLGNASFMITVNSGNSFLLSLDSEVNDICKKIGVDSPTEAELEVYADQVRIPPPDDSFQQNWIEALRILGYYPDFVSSREVGLQCRRVKWIDNGVAVQLSNGIISHEFTLNWDVSPSDDFPLDLAEMFADQVSGEFQFRRPEKM
ncbi:hypothetical protein [Haematomicrobium sanguinis]|uniref:hypothetical protein n=1 Tax=Haematomicrobium sanguinis TaxID=479106 RepID=UPI000478A251|nr:hypothetical protein [Haematomicrobium sanguinis]